MTAKHCRTNRRSRLLKFVVHILFYEDLRLDTFRRESEDKLRQSMLIRLSSVLTAKLHRTLALDHAMSQIQPVIAGQCVSVVIKSVL